MTRIQTLLNLAQEELLPAELLLNNNLYRACISRSYYALYHATQALLDAKNLNPQTHRGLIKQFGQHFIKSGDLSQDLSRILTDTFDLRQLSDYDKTISITKKQAETTLKTAKLFIHESIKWLENHNATTS
ncbi:HEPN domain protein [Gloeothece citriformis PCC 7424]|uniref:HEPN domain protein n=1 Tax=Gloeothece citriformis (strain PCC 7424) TaxID=65393 RepID=B7K9W6_GLOC7|nr:HEPN domain-containing protein [Gloeothece citriformis]ACK71322.1 HEPN domain protein [Gloeothece citriformis PCC 7424]